MQLTIVSATTAEIKPLLDHLQKEWKFLNMMSFIKKETNLHPLVTGVGSMQMAFNLARFQSLQKSDLIIHFGISGSFDENLQPGKLCEVVNERYGDLGAENGDGQLLNAYELQIADPDRYPFEKGMVVKRLKTPVTGLQACSGLTVNTVTGSSNTLTIRKSLGAQVESMEGIGLFYACRALDVPFVSIRSISNMVEIRNRNNWKMEEAIHQLNQFAIGYLESLVR